jgi:hypothetical protein
MLSHNGRTPPSAPQPAQQPQPDAEFDFNFDNSSDSPFNEWVEADIADAEAEATEEEA